MAEQNINQYVYKKYKLNLVSDSMDMSLTSDEKDYQEEVIFSPYIIAQTYGNKLPIYFDINNPLTAQDLTLTYKNFNPNNVFVSQNYYNPKNNNFCNYTASTVCDIGLTGIDNGLTDKMYDEELYFTNGLFDDSVKFDRLHVDRRLKLIQVTGHTGQNSKFYGIPDYTLYEVVSKNDPIAGKYHELYGGFYQGFYKLFGYDYDVLPERMNKGWSVELVLKPRLCDQYVPNSGETTLNDIYPNNKNTFFYFGTRAENKFYHYADGSPKCFTGYTRVTTPLSGCLQTCACCNKTVTDSRCIYVYPPRPTNGKWDPHSNYGCPVCGGVSGRKLSCGCNCGEDECLECGWECFTHPCPTVIQPTPTPTPTPSPTPTCDYIPPVCTPTCTTCSGCTECVDCIPSGFTSIEDTCEKDPLFDSMSNNISFKLCGDPKNPGIGVKVLRFTGECITTGTTTTGTGTTFVTGYTIQEWCTPPIYSYCENVNPAFINQEHWFLLDVVWERYTYLDECDLWYRGGLGDITEKKYLESLANNTVVLIAPPYTNNKKESEKIDLVNLNYKWIEDKNFRNGRLKIYVNGKKIYTIEDFEEVIPRALNTDKEKQLGVPFNISWGGGTQGLHENLTFSSCSALTSNYIQDPECFPTSLLSGTTLSGLTTNILLEKEFGGTFEGGISQFRMYVEPITSSEIRHNFNVLKNKFSLFDPFCPNCNTVFCEPNDFTYIIDDVTTTTTTEFPITTTTTSGVLLPFQLGRVYIKDERDGKYLIKNNQQSLQRLTTPPKVLTERYWDANGWWGDQRNTPQCVGYSWAHWLEDGPVQQSGIPPIIKPIDIYKNAQKLDEWYGENYDGTSVRGAVKYLKNIGKVKSYYWAFDLQTLIDTVMKLGPVVVGTNWYNGMFYPNGNGLIKIGGSLVGGHAYVINGVNTKTKQFRIKNSWGKAWGKGGHAFISFNDMTRLIREQGEICLATEIGS
jgi:hypothetical protein